jgi:hypothetical protein
MATEQVAQLRPSDFQRETSLGADLNCVLTDFIGDVRGLSLPKYTTNNLVAFGYTTTFRIPANLTMGTGLTFKLYVTDDGKNAADVGKKLYLGVTVKRLVADETTDVDASAGTEQLVSITMSSTAGGIAIGSLAIASANLDSAVVGDMVMIRLRRKGTDGTNDTCPGRGVLIGVDVQNT